MTSGTPNGQISNSIFINNNSTVGGAIWATNNTNISINNCTFSANSATQKGGAAYLNYVLAASVNSSIFEDN